MDIHDIKPPGGDSPLIGSDAQPVDEKRDHAFAETKDKLAASGSQGPESPALGVISQFSRSSLDDPSKLDAMVRASVSELVDSGQNISGPLSPEHKQSVVDYLSSDPIFRQQVESYLRKALG
jgi:hypothetical protein